LSGYIDLILSIIILASSNVKSKLLYEQSNTSLSAPFPSGLGVKLSSAYSISFLEILSYVIV